MPASWFRGSGSCCLNVWIWQWYKNYSARLAFLQLHVQWSLSLITEDAPKKLSGKRGFLTSCRACATVQTGKDVHCSSGRQMGWMMDISHRALRVLRDLAAHPLLLFCSPGGWEVIWTAASHLPSSRRVQACVSSAETRWEMEWSQLCASGSCGKWEAQTGSTGSKEAATGEESHCNAVMETALAGTRGFVPSPTGVWYNHSGTYGCVVQLLKLQPCLRPYRNPVWCKCTEIGDTSPKQPQN